MKLILKSGFELEIPKEFASELDKKIANGTNCKVRYADESGQLMCIIDIGEIALITVM